LSLKKRRSPHATSKIATTEITKANTAPSKIETKLAVFVKTNATHIRTIKPVNATNPPKAILSRSPIEKTGILSQPTTLTLK
jgi:hypothetical protein